MTPVQTHRKRRILRVVPLACVIAATLFGPAVQAGDAAPLMQDTETPTPTPTLTPTVTLTPTPTPTPTPSLTPTAPPNSTVFVRPLLMLDSYKPQSVRPGQEFDLDFRLKNTGGLKARNTIVSFSIADFIPRGTGGVLAAGVIAPDASTWYSQPMTASPSLTVGNVGTTQMTVSYTDDAGTGYSDTFNISLTIGSPQTAHSGPAATRTSTPGPRPQLLIQAYDTRVEALQPGMRFTLSLQVRNVGGSTARRITLILGGGTSSSTQGTPGAGSDGGVSGAGGDFTHFAPVGSSNLQFLGDLPAQESLGATVALIVSGAAQPGTYPLRVTFAYTDERGNSLSDDQVITLLVYSPPLLDVSFYMPPGTFSVGQPGALPLQVVNLGRSSLILGRMEVTAEGAEMINNGQLIGYLDPGAYFPLDAAAIPQLPGPLEVLVTIYYLDDFNQPQTINRTLTVEVVEAPPGEAGGVFGPEEPLAVQPQTFWQKLWRAVLGLLGLDSAQPQPTEEFGPQAVPQEVPLPVYPPPKG